MYFTRVLTLSLSFVLIGLLSCKDEVIDPTPVNDLACESEPVYLDTIYLDTESIAFVPYDGTETSVFKNAVGEEARFEPLFDFRISYHRMEFKRICMNGDTNHYSFNGEQYSVSKKCPDLNLQFYLNVFPQNVDVPDVFYDYFIFLLHSPPLDNTIDTSITLNFTTSYKGNQIPPTAHHYLQYKFAADTSFLNVPFQDVYYNDKSISNPPNSVFYTKQLGLIAFTDLNDVLWVFDRFE